ncbi:MAG: DUF1501 domain-containing protein [Pirellulales bacterium]
MTPRDSYSGGRSVENPVYISDLNATVLRALGIDHNRFTIKYQRLDWKLTRVEGAKVIDGLLARDQILALNR